MICCFFLKRLRSIRIHTPLNWASVNLRIRWNSLLRIPPSRGPLFVVPVGPQQRPMQRRQRRLGFGKSLDPWKIGQFFSEVNYHFAWDVSWMMFLDVYWYLISLIPIPWDSFDIDVSWGFFCVWLQSQKKDTEILELLLNLFWCRASQLRKEDAFPIGVFFPQLKIQSVWATYQWKFGTKSRNIE